MWEMITEKRPFSEGSKTSFELHSVCVCGPRSGFDGAEGSALGLEIGRSPVQVPPRPNSSILIKVEKSDPIRISLP